MQSCYKHKKNRQLCLIICSFAYLCCINTLWRSFINLCFYFSAVTQFTKQITNFTENVVKLFVTGNCEMGCWDLGFFFFVDKNSEHIKSSTIQIVVPEPSRSFPLYLSPILPFRTMLLRLISVALSSYSMHHSSCFAGWGPTETDFSVHPHYGDVQQQSHTWIISIFKGTTSSHHDLPIAFSIFPSFCCPKKAYCRD